MAQKIQDYNTRIGVTDGNLETAAALLNNVKSAAAGEGTWRMNLDTTWTLGATTFAILAVIGLAVMEMGWTRRVNVRATLFQNVFVISIVGLFVWFTGFAFSFGESPANKNGFIGNDHIFLTSENEFNIYAFDNFQFLFVASVAATMLFGNALTERLSTVAYVTHCALFSGFILPVAAHWIFSTAGFFSRTSTIGRLGTNGVVDSGFATFFLAGGAASLAGLILAGPRKGRYEDEAPAAFATGNCRVLQVIGTLMLWAGLLAIMPQGSTLSNDTAMMAGRIAIIVTLGGASGGIVGFLVGLGAEKYDITTTIQGALAGVISVAAGSALIEPFAAIFVGAFGTVLYMIVRAVLAGKKMDDPMGVVPIFFACGFWSMLVPGIFGTEKNFVAVMGGETNAYGFLYAGSGNQFAVQLFAAMLISLWSFLMTFAWCAVVNGFGFLIVYEEEEPIKQDE